MAVTFVSAYTNYLLYYINCCSIVVNQALIHNQLICFWLLLYYTGLYCELGVLMHLSITNSNF